MKAHLRRTLVLCPLLGLMAAASCGSDEEKLAERGAAGEGGASESGGEPASRAGSDSGLPMSGSGQGGRQAAAGASNAGAGAEPFATGGATDAGAAGNGGGGGGNDIDPIVDVGVGCNPPPALPRLSALAAGLPAEGLVAWLRADRGVYATTEQRVCAWADQSGHQRVFMSNEQARPLWGAASVGSQPGILFDGSGKYLSVGDVLGIPPTSARTFVAVVQLVSTTARFSAVMQGVGNSPGTYLNLDANTFSTKGSLEGAYLTNNAYDTQLATSSAARVHVLSASTMVPGTPVTSALSYRINGATQTLTRTSGGLGNGNIEDFSQANFTLVGLGASALVAEALIYDRVLAADELSAVEQALTTRYAIQ